MSSSVDSNNPYRFTPAQDWFSHNIDSWSKLVPFIKANEPRVLEIGSWEGRSAVYLLDTLCKDGGEIVCIDHFDLFKTDAGQQRFQKLKYNLASTGKQFRIIGQFSVPALISVLEEESMRDNAGFDWIYVDGSHESDDTLLDGELAWRLARKGCIFIFDDYHWEAQPEESRHHPKRGIEAFLALHAGEYDRLTGEGDYQVVLCKKTDIRIGFVFDNVTAETQADFNDIFEYGINIALTIDSSYAVGAAVAIRSIIETTINERITFYIVDCGLESGDREQLKACAGNKDWVTFKFVDLCTTSLTSKYGPAWAKIDLIDLLPVERVLYIDADVLVRQSIKGLWTIDLEGKGIGAILDIGYPSGHDETFRRPYFNAGVILMDLAAIRPGTAELKDLALKMTDSKLRDQDVLNAHFKDGWMSLDLAWNAQGLGTYARYPSEERNALPLTKMNDPKIVHFTGPVSPSMAEVLNPYVQPPTSKPWGYLGSPGHPYEKEWWDVLERTPWKGLQSSEAQKIRNSMEIEKVVKAGAHDFHAAIARFHQT